MVPDWLVVLSWVSLIMGFLCALSIVADILRHPQVMWIMNVVWPVCALFGSVLVLWFYIRYGRLAWHELAAPAMEAGETPPHKQRTPFPIVVAKGSLHCGSGCTLGDIVAEWLAFGIPAVAAWLGWHTLFQEKIFAVWVLDYLFAFSFGVVFQYFTIKPMRGLTVGQGIRQAVKADVLSLTAWQVGMYGFMAFAHFVIFKTILNAGLEVNSPEFWFMMQIAMAAGFATSYPVNWWLVRAGIKEKM